MTAPRYEPFGWHHWPEHFFMSYQFRRALGETRLHVSWHPVRGGPEPFYLKLGFVPNGRVIDDEIVAELLLA